MGLIDEFAVRITDDSWVIKQSWSDGERFAAVFDRHAAAIHRYLARRVGPQIAEDLTAQTFLIAFDRRRTFDVAHDSALPWLYGIATRLVARHRRAEIRGYRALARTGIEPEPDPERLDERVAARVTAAALSGRLAAAVADLPSGQRDVLLLVAWEGLAYEEVAAALRIPLGTVRSRLNRARAKVRAALGGSDPSAEDLDSFPESGDE